MSSIDGAAGSVKPRAGAAVVVEKPLCTTLADADRLVRVVDSGGVLTYAENLLFADATSTASTPASTRPRIGVPVRGVPG